MREIEWAREGSGEGEKESEKEMETGKRKLVNELVPNLACSSLCPIFSLLPLSHIP